MEVLGVSRRRVNRNRLKLQMVMKMIMKMNQIACLSLQGW